MDDQIGQCVLCGVLLHPTVREFGGRQVCPADLYYPECCPLCALYKEAIQLMHHATEVKVLSVMDDAAQIAASLMPRRLVRGSSI